jgi:outer membrane autotransporter protein
MATKAPLLASLPANRWSVWAAGYGGSEQVGGNAIVGSQDLSARLWGVAAGADYRVSPDTLLGFALGGGGLNYSLANAMGTGSADLFQAGVYGRHNFGPAYVAGALAYGWHDVTTNRTVALAGVDQLQARFNADTFSARFEGGYRYATPWIGITPYAAAQVTSFRLPNYSETSLNGGGLFALNYASQTTTDTRSELGLRTDKAYAMADGVLTLRGRAAWAHDYSPNRAVTALFQTLPGTAFAVNGARVDADSALVSGSAEMNWLRGFSIAATFDGEFSGNVTSYTGKGVFKYSW